MAELLGPESEASYQVTAYAKDKKVRHISDLNQESFVQGLVLTLQIEHSKGRLTFSLLDYKGKPIQIGGRYRTVVNFYWDKVIQRLFVHYEEQEMTTIILDFNVSGNTDELNRKKHDEMLIIFNSLRYAPLLSGDPASLIYAANVTMRTFGGIALAIEQIDAGRAVEILIEQDIAEYEFYSK
ncbi:hypothetical protein ACOMCU_01265 [Lysinibacillus sp. UGB7]|uniref:hypothetical protein n=1 Tax=Lysinibacillus sp. UGB7 TaxID=3411039 RepID=UPI003B77BA6F